MALEYPFELPATLFASIDMPIDTQIDAETLTLFGKALMTIAGADGRLSVWERGWLSAYMFAYRAPREAVLALDDFDFENADLNDYLEPLLAGPYSRWVRRSLVQGAIRMSQADEVAPEEYNAVLAAAETIGMSAPVVAEVAHLIKVFDSVTASNSLLLTIAQKEDAEEIARRRGGSEDRTNGVDEWSDEEPSAILPDEEALARGQATFAKALLWVAGADGMLGEAELNYFITYMRNWGVEEKYLTALKSFDYTNVDADDILGASYTLTWGLKALTSVAIRMAGADGLATEEEEALLKLYAMSGQSIMHYYATRGLEEVRALTLQRLNEIFTRYL